MKISIKYDVFKNGEAIQNACPLDLLDFAYSLITDSTVAHTNWQLFLSLPTQHSSFRFLLSSCGFDNIVNEHINAPITDGQTTMYIISPLGGAETYLGMEPPNISFIDIMSKKAKDLIKNRSMKLIIDYSAEGYNINRACISELHKLLNDEGIPLDNVYFISSNLLLEETYQHQYKFHNTNLMNIITGPFFEHQSFDLYQDKQTNKDIFQQIDMIKRKTRLKKFLCFNRRPHGHRHALVCLLSIENLLKDSFVSWPASIDHSPQNKENFLWHPFDGIFPPDHHLYNQLMEESKKLEKISPLIVDQINFFENFAYGYEDSTHYQNSYFSIITETIFSEHSTVFFSEKIWKPIANLHPFLLVATKGSLGKLRELGYKTFSPYINEIYDFVNNDADRMLAIVEEMKRLNNMPIDELNDMYYNNLLPILIHNRKWFFDNQIQHIKEPLQKIVTDTL